MRKSLMAALTGALVVGATATTFAAANPFSDVPAGHWAYDAVTRLTAEGVIEGYGDGTYRGNRNITRYEMAQMVARAMAKTPRATMSGASRADIDKLAAEFRDELDSLGVRVDELEKHSDMIKWAGKIEYTYGNFREKNKVDGTKTVSIGNGGVFRLEPVAEVNDHWNAVARFDASFDIRNDSTNGGGDEKGSKLKRVYGEGKYDKFSVKLGRFGFCPGVEDGMVVDTVVSGGELSFGSKWKFTVTAGRVGADSDEAHYYGGGTDRAFVTVDSLLDGINYYNEDKIIKNAGGDIVGLDKETGLYVYNSNKDKVRAISPDVKNIYGGKYVTGEVKADDGTTSYVIKNRDVISGADAATIGKIQREAANLYATLYAKHNNDTEKAAFRTAYGFSATEGDTNYISDREVVQLLVMQDIAENKEDYQEAIKGSVANAYATDVVGINVGYDSGEPGLYGVASFYHAKDKDFRNYFYSNDAKTDKANVWAANLGYRFSDDLKLWGGYAKNSKADNENSAWQAEIRYGNYGDYSEQGDWAIWAGYAKFGYNTAIASSQGDDVQTGTKGWHIGAAYAPFKNVGLLVRYSDGEYITSGDKYRKIFARGEWFF